MKGLFNFFRKSAKNQKNQLNLPDLIKQNKQSQLKPYSPIIEELKEQKDPLMKRINIDQYDYIYEVNSNLTARAKLKIYSKFIAAKLLPSKFRYSKILSRNNPHLHKIAFDDLPDYYFFPKASIIIFIALFTYFTAYWWARLRSDTYVQRYAWTHYPSAMIIFEVIDHSLISFIKAWDTLIPKDFSDKEATYLMYSSIHNHFRKRRANQQINNILETDKELLEIDELLKKAK